VTSKPEVPGASVRTRPVSPAGRLFDELDLLVELADLAPSPLALCPWRVRVHDGAVELRLDEEKLADSGPADRRQSTIACGAALLDLRLGVVHLGMTPHVAMLPDPGEPALVARIAVTAAHEPHLHEERLLAAMLRRSTRRTPFPGVTLPADVVDELTTAVADEGAVLQHVEGVRAAELDILLAEAEVTTTTDPARRAGLRARWAPDAARGSVHVVCTNHDEPVDWVRAGVALQHLLLEATHHDLAARIFTLALEDPHQREQVRRLACAGRYPQVVLELGPATQPFLPE
jgi:hypothetical protein